MMIQHLAKPASLGGEGGQEGEGKRTESHRDSLLWPGKNKNLGTGIPNSCASFCQKTAHDSIYKLSGKFNSRGVKQTAWLKSTAFGQGYVTSSQHSTARRDNSRNVELCQIFQGGNGPFSTSH